MINKHLLAEFMLDGGLEDFVSESIPLEDLDTFEVEMVCATAGVFSKINGKNLLIIPSEDKKSVFCVEKLPNGKLHKVDYVPTWEELSDILEKQNWEPSWSIPNVENSLMIEHLIQAYLEIQNFVSDGESN